MFDIAISVVVGYLLGSIPSAYLIARFRKGIDIRQLGSKNMGAMNVYYQVGTIEAAVVLFVDVSKGIGAILLTRYLLGIPLISPFGLHSALAGIAAVLGHAFPPFLQFRGGKGGATTLGILLFLMPKAIPFFIGVALAALLITRNLTFCYSVGFVVFPVVAWRIYQLQPLIFFSLGLPIFVGILYAPRLKEMHQKTSGDWQRIIRRSSIKQRF
jgi:glycerol-3-phosphate acyltransferase PlsY